MIRVMSYSRIKWCNTRAIRKQYENLMVSDFSMPRFIAAHDASDPRWSIKVSLWSYLLGEGGSSWMTFAHREFGKKRAFIMRRWMGVRRWLIAKKIGVREELFLI
jgi:hypothetical protein